MNYRFAEILADVDLGPDGTKPIDINLVDPVSRIIIKFRPVGGSVTPAAHPAASITKLELIDGSDVLFSLTGQEAHALNLIEAVNPVTTHIHNAIGGTPILDINIDFGRFLWDPLLAFDPTKFVNPQLKLSWNEVLWDGSCSVHAFGILAAIFDEKKITPQGFLSTKEVKAYAAAANAYEYTDLPVDLPLRKLILQGLKYGSPPRTTINTIKLSEDNDKRIVIDEDVYKLEPVLEGFSGECEDLLIGQATDPPRFFYITPSYKVAGGILGRNEPLYFEIGNKDGGRIAITPSTTGKNFIARLKGHFPHACMPINFGDQQIIEDWYSLAEVGSLALRIKGAGGAASTDTVRIITQQLRSYA